MFYFKSNCIYCGPELIATYVSPGESVLLPGWHIWECRVSPERALEWILTQSLPDKRELINMIVEDI